MVSPLEVDKSHCASSTVSEKSLREYQRVWRNFSNWCGEHGLNSLPATNTTVLSWIHDRLRQGIRPNTLYRSVSAITYLHRVSGHTLNIDREELRHILASQEKVMAYGKELLLPNDIFDMLAHLPKSDIGWRDRALILLGYALDLNRAQLTGIDVKDVNFILDDRGRPRGLVIDASEERPRLEVKPGDLLALCPVQAVWDWIQTSGIEHGPLFRNAHPSGWERGTRLSCYGVTLVLKRAAKRAGLDPVFVSSSSLLNKRVNPQSLTIVS